MTQAAGGLNVWTMESGRRYVSVADLVLISGISALDLENKHKPAAWGTPRDFVWDGRTTWFAILSLQQLIDGLIGAGLGDAAGRLREKLTPYITAAVAETQPQPPRPVSDDDWKTRWEREHE